ncbi:MAG: T9SS type A sorting domain-containing protein [Ignavibacteriae bacterium]|nr:T9SS type A sorting domain-containing protein [Ignavibacteriota bacterium]
MRKIFYLTLMTAFIVNVSISQDIKNAPNYVGKYKGGGSSNSGIEQKKAPRTITPQEQSISDEIMNLKHSGSTDFSRMINLQKQLDAINQENVTKEATPYNGTLVPAVNPPFIEPDAIGNTQIANYFDVKAIATATESTGKLWTVICYEGAGGPSTPDSISFFSSINGGTSWVLYSRGSLSATDKFNYDDLDIEIIEPATGDKYMYVVYGLRSSGGTGWWVAGGVWLRLTGTFGGDYFTFGWPDDNASKRYYNVRITSDNSQYASAPWLYVVCSFDSGTGSYIENTQKFARCVTPYTTPPIFTYKADKPFWWMGVPTNLNMNQRNLYSDIAYFRNTNDSIIISFSGVPDSTKLFFSKHDINGTSPSLGGQVMEMIGGSEPNLRKAGTRLASNGNSNGAIFAAFRQLIPGSLSNNFHTKYFRTDNFGNFNTIAGQSVLNGGTNGVIGTDIIGVKNGDSFRYTWLNFSSGSTDSVRYASVNADGNWPVDILKMNPSGFCSQLIGPRAGYRMVPDDSCFAIYKAQPNFVRAAFGCTGEVIGINPNTTPVSYNLSQNFPNPFNPSTRISYSIPKDGFVKITIYDILGKEAGTLVNSSRKAGTYIIEFNASALASGIYFYSLIVDGDNVKTKKMIMAK